MSLNQQLREPRVLAILNPRVIALIAFVAAALVAAGCASAPPPSVSPGIAQAPPLCRRVRTRRRRSDSDRSCGRGDE